MMAHSLYITHLAHKSMFIVGDYRTCYAHLRVRLHVVVPEPLQPQLEDLLRVRD